MRCAFALAALATFVPRAGAEAPEARLGTARLRYARAHGADACPDQAALAAEVIGRLGYDPFADASPRKLDVEIVAESGGLRATITLAAPELSQPSTHRLVSNALDCRTLHGALALALALAIDPARALAVDVAPALPSPVAPHPFPPPAPTPAPAPLVERPRTPAEVRPPRPHGAGLLYAGGYAAVAAGPATTGGVDIGGGVRFRRVSMAVELRGDIPSRGVALGGAVEVGRLMIQGVPCFRAAAFGLCALASFGVSFARGHGFVVTRDVDAPYVAFGARLMAEIPLARRIGLQLHADVLGLVTRLSLRVDSTVTYADSPASGAFGIDLLARFGDGS